MGSKRLRKEWDEIPGNGFLPDDIKMRMWKNIRNATIDTHKHVYKWIAAACIVFSLSFIGYQFSQSESFKTEAIVTRTFPDDIRLLRLPDGTRVWVNQNTEIEYPEHFSPDERTITLKGEAFFEVQRDTLRPFIITSGIIKTTVLGTSFNVKAYNGKAPEVIVRNGKVKVESEQNTVLLEKGDAAIYVPVSEKLQKKKSGILEPEWKKVLIDIDGLSLSEVIEKLKLDKVFTVQYSDENLKQLKIKGTLDTRQGFSEMLETISFALNIEIRHTSENNYLISNLPM